MAILIYHKGTGTYFDATDGVVLIDTDDLEEYSIDTDLYDGAVEHGLDIRWAFKKGILP